MTASRTNVGLAALEAEVAAEQAASLGRAGRKLQDRLKALQHCRGLDQVESLTRAAADAAYAYFVQRELLGISDHRAVIEDYGIPPSVLALIGSVAR